MDQTKYETFLANVANSMGEKEHIKALGDSYEIIMSTFYGNP
jgi:hypothetical protein